MNLIRSAYLRIGIHTAPQDTLLGVVCLHAVRALGHRKTLGFGTDTGKKYEARANKWFRITNPGNENFYKKPALREKLMNWLRSVYLKIGLHTAPPDTYLGFVHLQAIRFFGRRQMHAFGTDIAKKYEAKANKWFRITNRVSENFYGRPIFKEELRHGDDVMFDLHAGVKLHNAKGLVLFFFMGLGDYFFITPFIRQLRLEFPDLKILAYVSDGRDSNNNPGVADLLKDDPNIDEVRYFHGHRSNRSSLDWRNYDYKDAVEQVPQGYLGFPVIYGYNFHTRNRAAELCRVFGLSRPQSLLPIIYTPDISSEAVARVLEEAERKFIEFGFTSIAFLQLETRSSNYRYMHTDELCRRMAESKCLVISVTALTQKSDQCVEIDISRTSFRESVVILRELHKKYRDRLTMITTQSVFAAVSSGLRIECLQLQQRHDHGVSNLWFDNITLVSDIDYASLPEEKVALIPPKFCEFNDVGTVSYPPEMIVNIWKARFTDCSSDSCSSH